MPPGLKACLQWNCKALSPEPYCPKHTPKWGWSASTKGIYRSKWWRTIRLTVLAEEPRCSICHKEPSTEVDHTINLARGGEDERANLRGVCSSCHQDKTSRESKKGQRVKS